MSGRRAAAAGLAGLALAGCGGGGPGGAEAKPDSEVDRWRKAADAICDRAEKAIRDGGQPKHWDDLDRVLVRAGDHVLAAVEDIRALPVPEEGRAVVRPLRQDLKEIPREVRRFREVVEADDPKALQVWVDDYRIVARQRASRAEQAGLRRCGRESQLTAAADELLMPRYADSVAFVTVKLAEDVEPLVRRARAAAGADRVRAWQQVSKRVRSLDELIEGVPERMERLQDRFGIGMYSLEGNADELQVYVTDGPEAKARRFEARAARRVTQLKARGIQIVRETGAAGRELLPIVRERLRRAG